MFGNKQAKERRLEQIVSLLEQHGPMSQAEIAAHLRVPRSTVLRDLPTLEDRGVLLAEDRAGHVSLARRSHW